MRTFGCLLAFMIALLSAACALPPDAPHQQEYRQGAPAAPVSVKCPKCGHENRPGARFCAECGTLLHPGGCPRCGAEIVPGDRFCTQCGLDLSNLKTDMAKTPQAPERMPEIAEVHEVHPSMTIGGFSDVVYSGSNPGSPRNFNLGQFVLHFHSSLAPKVSFFSELSLAPRADAGTGSPSATGYNAEVERVILRLDQSDLFKISFGRYHTPVNWWNTAFHHGAWLQTTIDRPQMTKFGGQFIPVHFVGTQAEGALPAGGLNLNYDLGLGNGRGSVVSRAGDAGDNNAALAWLANIFVRPDRMDPLQIGGSVYRDRITLTNGNSYREWILAGHVVWRKETPELIAEYAHANHVGLNGGGRFNSEAYYFQAAYRLPWFDQRFKPYFRFEKMSISAKEPVFTSTSSLQGYLAGLRYDFTDYAALKLEYRNLRQETLPNITGFFSQLSYVF
jgi:hypothetical protein